MSCTSLLLLAVGLLGAAAPAVAQSVVAYAEPPSEPASATATPAGSSVNPLASSRSTAPPAPIEWGPIAVRPYFVYWMVYGDGIRGLDGTLESTYIDRYSVGVSVGLGERWSLNYAPAWIYYSNSGFRDTVEHALELDGEIADPDWNLQVAQRYNYMDSPQVQTGRQTGQHVVTTTGIVALNRGPSLAFNVSAEQRFTFIEALPDTHEWIVTPGVDYSLSSQLRVGAGVAAGYTAVYEASDMFYVRPLGRLSWRLTNKTSFNLQGGVEQRQFLGRYDSQRFAPHYSATAIYAPFQFTSITLSTELATAASFFADQAAENERYSFTFDQRLLGHFFLNVRVGDQTVRYLAAAPGETPARRDNLVSCDVRGSTTFLRRGTAAVIYQYNWNRSNTQGYGFTSHQIGFEIAYRY